MGMFDTIHLPVPLQLPGCEKGVTDFQTKAFGSLLEDYTIGSCCRASPVLIGVVPETAFGVKSDKVEGESGTFVHCVSGYVWHCILVGVYAEPERKRKRAVCGRWTGRT
jgi:hypothetical protein